MTLRISSELLAQMQAAALASPGLEVCGLLMGQDRHVTAVMQSANVSPTPASHFEIDPAVLIAAHRTARHGGPQIIGNWHSHPAGAAYPSAEDARCAAADGQFWIIVGHGDVGCWQAVENGSIHNRFEHVPLAVV